MAYPTRGTWRFRNVTRSFDFTPTLESISIQQEYPDLTASLSCLVVDDGEGWAFDVEDEVRVTFAGERIFAGHIKTATEDALSEVGPRAWRLDGQDYTAKLSDALVRRRRKRKREKAKRRVRWLLRQMTRRVWSLDDIDLSHVPDEYVEAYDYFGATVDEALSHVADETRCHYYIDLDNVFRMYRSDTVAAPFDLDNNAPDFATTFPFREWTRSRDSVELGNAVLVEPEKRKHARWSKDATSITAYGRQERFVSDFNLHRSQQAKRLGARTLAVSKDPTVEGSCVIHEPGVWGGMTLTITEDRWSRADVAFVSGVAIEALDPHDGDDAAMLRSTLTFTTRKRRGGATGSINKNSRKRQGQVGDVNPYDLDRFDRIVSPPALTPGASVGSFATYQASKGVDKTWTDIPFTVGSAALQLAASYVGAGYEGHTTEDCGCPGLDNCFKGWKDIERWYWLTVPAHPANAAGIAVTVTSPALDGVAGSKGADVVVLSAQPTDTWQGGVAGHVGPLGGDVVIPIGAVPAPGGELHVGLRAGWHANYGSVVCGWVWPFTSGEENSGRYRASITSPTWQTYTASGDPLGAMVTDSKAPWEGGNTWRDGGSEGAPVSGMDGTAYYVTAEAIGSRTLYVVGEREDDDEPRGPWSDAAWALELTFDLDAHGDTATAGPRVIQVTTTGEGDKTVGTVHLGDSTRDEGISVGGPATEVYAAKALTLGAKWRAKFDSRSGKMRAKMWALSDPEPAAWDVETPMEETEDDADRWELTVRLGNGPGDSQTVRIHRIRAHQDADDGKRVVKELIGTANGSDAEFATCHPFRQGTLRVYVNGVGVGPSWEDGDGARFRLDFWPTARSIIRASYTVDQGEGDEE